MVFRGTGFSVRQAHSAGQQSEPVEGQPVSSAAGSRSHTESPASGLLHGETNGHSVQSDSGADCISSASAPERPDQVPQFLVDIAQRDNRLRHFGAKQFLMALAQPKHRLLHCAFGDAQVGRDLRL